MVNPSSSSAATFAPFQPPPDEAHQQAQRYQPSPAVAPPSPPPKQRYMDENPYEDDPRYATESYQSGSLQHQQQQQQQQFQQTQQGGFGGSQAQQSLSSAGMGSWGSGVQPDAASYMTSQGVSISNLCFMAWALPPFSGVFVLIFETTNDLARFHAYQSSLCGVGMILALYILRSWFGWYTLSIIFGMGSLGACWVAGNNAHRAAPTLGKEPYLPYVGPLAEEWVGSE